MTAPWLRTLPVAHRGLHDLGRQVPENSLAAFRAAVAADYAIELDVRPTADGVPVVFHDATTDRLLGRPGRLVELTAGEVGRLALLGTGETVPTLREVTELVGGRAPLLIEIKSDGGRTVGPLEQAVLAVLDGYGGPFALQSFDPRVIEWLRQHAPTTSRGQIATRPEEMTHLTEMERLGLAALLDAFHGEPQFLSYDRAHLPSPLSEAAHRRHLPVLAWTVRTREEARSALAHADNIIFENWLP